LLGARFGCQKRLFQRTCPGRVDIAIVNFILDALFDCLPLALARCFVEEVGEFGIVLIGKLCDEVVAGNLIGS
jgi:hypothetical protein